MVNVQPGKLVWSSYYLILDKKQPFPGKKQSKGVEKQTSAVKNNPEANKKDLYAGEKYSLRGIN